MTSPYLELSCRTEAEVRTMTDQPPSTAAPTPGPWKIDPDNATQVLAKDFTGTYRRLAKVYGWGRKDSKANAKLFAAAPETAAERDRLQLEIEQCHAKSTCCCGDYMKHHAVDSGHNPVSIYDSALFNIEAARDRLVVVNADLLAVIAAAQQLRTTLGTTVADWAAWDKSTRAVLAEARKR